MPITILYLCVVCVCINLAIIIKQVFHTQLTLPTQQLPERQSFYTYNQRALTLLGYRKNTATLTLLTFKVSAHWHGGRHSTAFFTNVNSDLVQKV